MKPARFEYVRPSTLAEAVGALAGAADARVMAGNQSLGPMLNLRIARPTLVVDISRLSELRRVENDDTGITIGACVTHSAIEDGEAPDAANGLMRRVAGGIAYRAVRNRGTIGGSLAHADPAADWPPVLVALDAEVKVRGPKGGRNVPAVAFATGILETALAPGEVIEAIRIPRLDRAARFGHQKVSCKPGDFADGIAVVVIDRSKWKANAVIAGPTQPPRRLDRMSSLIATVDGWTAGLERDLRGTVAEDLRAVGRREEDDRYAFHLHQTLALRAAREALGA
jgi:carbon-monoxide dehydrogenase medium subunit